MKAKAFVLACVLVALAAGIALGAGPLQHGKAVSRSDTAAARTALARRDASIAALRRVVAADGAFAGAVEGRVVAGSLADRKVALVTLPGVSADTVRLLAGLVHVAGAEVTAQLALTTSLVAGDADSLLTPLTSQMAAQSPGAVIPAASNGYQRLGALLARAIAVPPAAHVASAPYDATAVSIIAGLETAKVVQGAHVAARAGLVLLVLPGRTGSRAYSSLAALLKTFGSQIPTVVAAPAEAASRGGLLTALRSLKPPFTTVDGLDGATGQVSAVLALVARTRGVVGAYGSAGRVAAPVPPLF